MAEPNTQRSCFLAQRADCTFHQPWNFLYP